ncbi:carbohydrate kinase family protein [Clostridium senegalense]|uniref:carbohydrate kinase family protein n=1 Tax=Clostridium senegalense TaxID=1465809 RepID=UPI0002881300|nr:carbohydrate kinase family protein [Clostridium senegalense]
MGKDNNSYVLVLGMSIIDILGFCGNKYKACDSIPGNIKISFGGVCRNIAENLARVGVDTQFISVIGDDKNGKDIIEHSKQIGYCMENSLMLEDSSTPTYMAVLNEHGEMVSAVVDMESANKLDSKFIDSKADVIRNSEYTVLDSDNPELLKYILETFKGETKFILDPISSAKAANIKHLIPYFHTIKPNRLEAEALCGFKIKNMEDAKRAGKFLLNQGVENVFISLDVDGVYYCNNNCCGLVKSEQVEVKNVTGAGDSFVSGIAYGYMNNLSMDEIVKVAIAMSVITIRHEETINPNMSMELVEKTIKELQWL